MIARSRTLLARYVPPGAIMLAVLTFAAYVAGLVRDRIFARTYGAGPELDAYNAAFVLPELLLDVLVGERPHRAVRAGVHHARSRRPRRGAAVRADGADAGGRGDGGDEPAAPPSPRRGRSTLIAPGFDGANQARYLDLFRLMLLTPIVFAASIALGEVLVAERHFVYYALAPILYNVGIVAGHGAAPRPDRDRRGGRRRGHRLVPPPRDPARRHAPHDGAGAVPAATSGCPRSTSSCG